MSGNSHLGDCVIASCAGLILVISVEISVNCVPADRKLRQAMPDDFDLDLDMSLVTGHALPEAMVVSAVTEEGAGETIFR